MQPITKEISEIAGFFAADGSMQKKYICFWGNPIEDKEYYDNVLKDLFRKSFRIEVNPHEKKSNGVYGFYVCKRTVINFFNENLGFEPGSKTYKVEVPKIILENKNPEIQKAFLRGYASGDGGLNFYRKTGNYCKFKKKFHYYPRFSISSVSEKVIEQLREITEKNGIECCVSLKKNLKGKRKNKYCLTINGKKRLENYAKLVGIPNMKDFTKLELFRKFGFVPPRTSIQQRYRILNNEVSIYDFYQGP